MGGRRGVRIREDWILCMRSTIVPRGTQIKRIRKVSKSRVGSESVIEKGVSILKGKTTKGVKIGRRERNVPRGTHFF